MGGKLGSKIRDFLFIFGQAIVAAAAGTTNPIKVLIRDGTGDILYATGTDVPVDTTSGYAKGCLFIDTNVATGTTGLYCNKGTNTSCVFTAVTQA
jgi:hypothetical protein